MFRWWVAAAAVAMQTIVWTTLYDVFGILRLGYGFFEVSDVPHYYETGIVPIARGLLPFRDFFVEYPPLFVPLLVAPGLDVDLATYGTRFAILMVTLVAAACAVTAIAAGEADDARVNSRAADGAGTSERPFVVAALYSAFTLLLGPIAANRFDAAVALVLAFVVLFLARARWVPAAVAIGIGFALKITPVIVLPLVLLFAPPRSRPRMLACFAAAAAIPFLFVLSLGHDSAANLQRMFAYHLSRPLEIESVLATPFWIAKLLGLTRITVGFAAGSQVIVSAAAEVVAKLSTAVLLASLASVFALAWRRREAVAADWSLQLVALLATVLASFVGSKVLSPQYFVWVVPLLALVAVERRVLGGMMAVVLLLTQVEFPANYWAFARSQLPGAIAIVVARNVVLVAAFALSLRHLWKVPQGVPAGLPAKISR